MKRASEWVVTWVSEARPGEEQEARFNTWEGAMVFYRNLIDSPLFSDVHIKALEQQPCEDCISRAEALKHSYIVYDDELERHNVVSVEDIEELPTIMEADKAESEDPDCEYYRNMCGGICFAQKCAPRCECRGIKERCGI